jgi:predicted secreted protein
MSAQRFDQSQSAIQVGPGDSFILELPSAPTTGYAWTLQSSGSKLHLVDESFEAASERMGAGGLQRFEFQAKEAGKVTLKFAHGRPWESEPDETHEVTVTVGR